MELTEIIVVCLLLAGILLFLRIVQQAKVRQEQKESLWKAKREAKQNIINSTEFKTQDPTSIQEDVINTPVEKEKFEKNFPQGSTEWIFPTAAFAKTSDTNIPGIVMYNQNGAILHWIGTDGSQIKYKSSIAWVPIDNSVWEKMPEEEKKKILAIKKQVSNKWKEIGFAESINEKNKSSIKERLKKKSD